MKTLVVIPAKDEELAIGKVLSALSEQPDLDILVIDDGSKDNTVSIAKQHADFVLKHVVCSGAWIAMQTGIRFALKNGYQRVITMDADGQHLPSEIPTLLKNASTADVVIGSYTARASSSRKFAWKLFRAITGLNVRDVTSGFRVYNLNAMKILSSRQASLLDYQDVGVLLMLRSAKLSITETFVRMENRQNGGSRIFSSWFNVGYYMLATLILSLTKAVPENRHKFQKRLRIK
jgi:glycosyltransferase involved in cell wall biosynthesis